MENLLKKQLAQIKARALMLAGRASESEKDVLTAKRESTPAPPVDSEPSHYPDRSASARIRADFDGPSFRRGPSWWQRRLADGRYKERRAEREHGFEAEFQKLVAGWSVGEAVSIEDAVPGVAATLQGSPYYLIAATGSGVDPIAPLEVSRFKSLRTWPDVVVRTSVGRRPVHGFAPRGVQLEPQPRFVSPSSVIFLDIETAGLMANTYVFLCGLMHVDADGHFRVEQIFARDYTEEEGLLRYVRSRLEQFDTVVTYNGATFDLPFLRTRMSVHLVPDIEPIGSVDLLIASRRVFKPALPNCRLVTVERHLRGIDRVDDIPSRFIPRAYHEFVRTKDARLMRPVVYHNRMDLFTMVVILNHLADVVPAPPAAAASAEPRIPLAAPTVGDTIAAPNPPHVPY